MLSYYLANSFVFDGNPCANRLKCNGKIIKSNGLFPNTNGEEKDSNGKQINSNNKKPNPHAFIFNNNTLKLNPYFVKSMLRSMHSLTDAFNTKRSLFETYYDMFVLIYYRHPIKGID